MPVHQQHLEYILVNGDDDNKTVRAINCRESPLDTLMRRGRIDQVQFQAGLLFRRDFEQAGMIGIRGFDITRERVDGSPARDFGDIGAQKRARLNTVVNRLGRRSLGLVVNVCALGIGLNEIEKRCGLPRSSGLPLLQDGLDVLAGHYALQTPSAANGNYQGADWLPGLNKR